MRGLILGTILGLVMVPVAAAAQSGQDTAEISTLTAKAEAAWKANNHVEAADAYKRLLALQPKDSTAAYRLGWLYNELEKYADAIVTLKTADSMKPGDADTLEELGFAYRHLSRFEEGLAAYRDALKANPDAETAYLGIGQI